AATFTETLAARETLQLTGGMADRQRRFAAQNAALRAAEDRTVDVELRLRLIGFLEGLSVAVLLVAGAWLAGSGRVTIGTVAVFVLAVANLFEGVLRLSQVLGELQSTAVSLARLLDLLERTADRPAPDNRALPETGDLTVKSVRYAYRQGTDVLDGVDVSFPHGAHVAIAGPTGSGKSTLVKLASGLYQPDAGTVTFGGVDLAGVAEAEVRRRIVLVPQQVHLVSGTLADNLMLVPHEPTRDELLDAVDRLGLTAWLAGLPDGLDTVVGPYGSALSAGEQQLVGIVRAALVDPAVLILDEATADLDPVVAAQIETAVDRVRAGRTLILVAHRPETIARHATVVHVDDGVVTVS
ncbi:ABC transporter ATP-binding protein, partial [Jiangella anatolica]